MRDDRMPPGADQDSKDAPLLPEEVEIYINPDGSVTFADLSEGALPIAQDLAPDDPLLCELDPPSDDASPDDQP